MHQQKNNLHFQIKSLRFQQNQDQRQTLAFLEGDPSGFCQFTCNVTLALPKEVELSQFFLHIFIRFRTFSLYFYALCITFLSFYPILQTVSTLLLKCLRKNLALACLVSECVKVR
jgi:hypothetical protein